GRRHGAARGDEDEHGRGGREQGALINPLVPILLFPLIPAKAGTHAGYAPATRGCACSRYVPFFRLSLGPRLRGDERSGVPAFAGMSGNKMGCRSTPTFWPVRHTGRSIAGIPMTWSRGSGSTGRRSIRASPPSTA